MGSLSYLYARHCDITPTIRIMIPTVGEVIDNEEVYYDLVCSIIATPYDMMVQLDDIGRDFSQVKPYELFCMMWDKIKRMDTKLVFGDLDLTQYYAAQREDSGEYAVINPDNGDIIDAAVYNRITQFIRKMLFIPRTDKKPGNDEARKYMIEKARKKMKRMSRKPRKSQIEDSIIALVNTSEFPYTYDTVRDLSIYQFNASLRQIAHKIKYDKIMTGYYAGTIKYEDIDQSDRSWILESKES